MVAYIRKLTRSRAGVSGICVYALSASGIRQYEPRSTRMDDKLQVYACLQAYTAMGACSCQGNGRPDLREDSSIPARLACCPLPSMPQRGDKPGKILHHRLPRWAGAGGGQDQGNTPYMGRARMQRRVCTRACANCRTTNGSMRGNPSSSSTPRLNLQIRVDSLRGSDRTAWDRL